MNFFKSNPISLPKHNCLLPHALRTPSLEKLVGKRVVLASNSPRRKDILSTFVGQGIPLQEAVSDEICHNGRIDSCFRD